MKKLLFLLLFIPFVSFGQTAEEYFQSGLDKDNNGDYYGAIADYNKAIELNPDAATYYNRAVSKRKLEDFNGAIADYTKAIEINPNYALAYINRGGLKVNLKDFDGAIADYTKAIEINPSPEIIQLEINEYPSLDLVLALNPSALAYSNRGIAKIQLEDFNGAIADFNKAIEIMPIYTTAYYNRGIAKIKLEDYNGAIADSNKAIGLNPNYAAAYFNRAIAKFLLGINGCADVRKAKELGYNGETFGMDVDKLIGMVCNKTYKIGEKIDNEEMFCEKLEKIAIEIKNKPENAGKILNQNIADIIELLKYMKQTYYNGNPKYYQFPTLQEWNIIIGKIKSDENFLNYSKSAKYNIRWNAHKGIKCDAFANHSEQISILLDFMSLGRNSRSYYAHQAQENRIN